MDAIIKFPERMLPIDAKFPREQVLPLFETSDERQLEEARAQLVRVLTAQAKSIAGYIDPEHGTMDVALMYLPSETLVHGSHPQHRCHGDAEQPQGLSRFPRIRC